MCAYVSVHVYIRTSAGTCIPQSTCKSQTTPPCLKQDPFAAEFTILPGEQTSGDPRVSILHLPCMGLQLFMLSYSIHVHLMFTQQQNS